ncbi:MAG TPA: endonuclease/exonuclease/phosphatase family protein, partial [Flavobacterium sp.]|nr:endonuclease/exonuclease/phosphatase family protein [Flavobacterium sp.]
MHILKILLYFFSFIAIISILLPLVRKDLWVFRIFDYPRLQKSALIGILAIVWLVFFRESTFWPDLGIMAFLSAAFFYLLYLILPFTFMGKTMIAKAEAKGGKTLSLLVANIYQNNNNYQKLLALVKKRHPDIVFLVETDEKWLEGVKELREEYPHFIEIPLGNTYGLLFYSRLPIKNSEINYLIDKEIPSIIADVEFAGQAIRIFGLHPTPPVPQENDHSTDRDAEILLVGKMAKEHEGPCLVIGDLNDVAWSYTTKLFL